jgi:hypothetical protein
MRVAEPAQPAGCRAERSFMESEGANRLGVLSFDERTETWYVQPPESQRLMLTRQSLARLVQMYNSIHRGRALVLLERSELQRLEEARRRHSETIRDLHLALDRRRRNPLRVALDRAARSINLGRFRRS